MKAIITTTTSQIKYGKKIYILNFIFSQDGILSEHMLKYSTFFGGLLNWIPDQEHSDGDNQYETCA